MRSHFLLFAAGCVAAGACFYGARTGAGQTFYVDEWFYDRYALELAQRFALGPPVSFSYVHPSGYSLVLGLVFGVYYLAGRLLGEFSGLADFLVAFATRREEFVVLGRWVSAAFTVAALVGVYRLGNRLFSRSAAMLAAASVALCYPLLFYAHLAASLAMVTCLTTWAAVAVERVWRRGEWRDYLAAGAMIGAGIGTKYYPVLLVPGLCLAHLWQAGGLRCAWTGQRLARLVGALSALACSALLFFPVPLLEPEQWRRSLGDTMSFYSGGPILENAWRLAMGSPLYWANSTAEPVSWWANSLRTVGVGTLCWLGAGLVVAFIRSRRPFLLLAPPFLVLFTYQVVRGGLGLGARQLYSSLPLLFVLAAGVTVAAIEIWVPAGRRRDLAVLLVGCALLLQPTAWAVRYLRLLSGPTTVEIGRAWLQDRVPTGAVVLVDSMVAPFGETAGWREWRDRAGAVDGRTASAVGQARAAAAPPFKVVEMVVGDADTELSEAANRGGVVFVVTTDFFSTGYWSEETRRAWGNLEPAKAAKARRFFSDLERLTETLEVIRPREVGALGPTVRIARVR